MKKQTLLLALFISLGFSKANCQTQTPDWVWARGAQNNASGGGEGMSIATDKSNNVYITGEYQDIITFGTFILTSSGNYSCYLAKYDSSGNVKWAVSAVSSVTGGSVGYNVCTDIYGNVYVIGYFLDTLSLGSYTLTSAGNVDIFLAKYDLSGNVLWAKSTGGINYDYGCGVSTDLSGNVYVTGYFNSPTITFGSYTLTNAGGNDIFIAKYDSSGNVKWAESVGNNGDDEALSIATDTLANVYITGGFSSPLVTFGSYTLNNTGSWDVFLTKYDSSGNVLWAKSVGGNNNSAGYYVATDPLDNAYLTGYYYSSSITFGLYTLFNTGGYDAFLAKFSSSGNVQWAKNIGGTGDEVGYGVSADKSYRIYITGRFTSPSFTCDTITIQRPAVYYDPMYIAGYDSAGHVLFAKALGSGADDQNAVASSPSGCLYIGGDFYGVNPFIIGSDSLHLSGLENPFVAKLCYPQSGEDVPEISPAKEFILYPNPFEDKLTASPPAPLQRRGEKEGFELTLFDVMGRLLLRCSFVNSTTINTEQLARGIYFYEVRDKDGVGARGKVVKE